MSSVSEAAIVLYQQGVEASEEEKALANELNLKLLANSEGFANNEELASAADCYLQIKPCGLCLIVKDGNSFTSTHVDFADAKLNYRVQDKGKTTQRPGGFVQYLLGLFSHPKKAFDIV